ncbi:MAG: LUD domain-containing protein [Chloroflexota bacterium]
MAATPKSRILAKLRDARTPFEDVPPIEEKRHTVPNADASPDELLHTFITEAEKLSVNIHEAGSESDALETVLELLAADKTALTWDYDHIPLSGLQAAFEQNGISRAEIDDGTVRVGITGVDAALAGTGGIVVISGRGKSRQASLLPLVHIAVLRRDQITPNLETFYATTNRETFRDHSNIAVITGPSKSADIAMELIHGMHGPKELHIIIVP